MRLALLCLHQPLQITPQQFAILVANAGGIYQLFEARRQPGVGVAGPLVLPLGFNWRLIFARGVSMRHGIQSGVSLGNANPGDRRERRHLHCTGRAVLKPGRLRLCCSPVRQPVYV